jgi:hypothetical protein
MAIITVPHARSQDSDGQKNISHYCLFVCFDWLGAGAGKQR